MSEQTETPDPDDDDEAAAWAAIRRDWGREQMDRADERAEGDPT